MSLKSEIFEQPDVLGRLFADRMSDVKEIAGEISNSDIAYIFLAARGTSDNAGRYAKYLWGAHNRIPTALATPSLFSLYEKPPLLRKSLVVGISQSGESPDIVHVIEEGSRQNAPTLAITNNPNSPLAKAAKYVINLDCGPEVSVAATKTYTAQLMAIAMLSVALEGDSRRCQDLERVRDWVSTVLTTESVISSTVERYRDLQQCVVLGRGYNYATAFEWALKLKELTYAMAEPYSSADFQHGPVAIISKGFPVFAIVPEGMVYADMMSLLTSLTEEKEVDLLVISNVESALKLTPSSIAIPSEIPEWLSPIVSIVPAQLISLHIAQLKGIDAEKPRGLKKVTHTW